MAYPFSSVTVTHAVVCGLAAASAARARQSAGSRGPKPWLSPGRLGGPRSVARGIVRSVSLGGAGDEGDADHGDDDGGCGGGGCGGGGCGGGGCGVGDGAGAVGGRRCRPGRRADLVHQVEVGHRPELVHQHAGERAGVLVDLCAGARGGVCGQRLGRRQVAAQQARRAGPLALEDDPSPVPLRMLPRPLRQLRIDRDRGLGGDLVDLPERLPGQALGDHRLRRRFVFLAQQLEGVADHPRLGVGEGPVLQQRPDAGQHGAKVPGSLQRVLGRHRAHRQRERDVVGQRFRPAVGQIPVIAPARRRLVVLPDRGAEQAELGRARPRLQRRRRPRRPDDLLARLPLHAIP
jgi:hypothetical protein